MAMVLSPPEQKEYKQLLELVQHSGGEGLPPERLKHFRELRRATLCNNASGRLSPTKSAAAAPAPGGLGSSTVDMGQGLALTGVRTRARAKGAAKTTLPPGT